MANFNRKSDPIVSAINNLATALYNDRMSSSGSSYYSNKDLANRVSTESMGVVLSDREIDAYHDNMSDLATHLTSTELFGNSQVLRTLFGTNDVSGIPQHSLESAQILAAASGNLTGYNVGQLRDFTVKGVDALPHDMLNSGPYGDLSISPNQMKIATESFDEVELNKYLQYSIIYNVMASRQDPLNEAFFRPLTITQDEIGYVVSVRVEEVYDGFKHDPDGTVVGIVKHKLIDALVHPEILDANGTELIPYVQKGGSITNTDSFVEEALVAPYDVMLENQVVTTAPLKINEKHSLLGLSSHPSLIASGLMNQRDTLDGAASLKNVYVKVGEKVVKYITDGLNTSSFYKTPEGDMNLLGLTFINGSFEASKHVATIDGQVGQIPEFAALTDAGYDVRLEIRLNGTLRRDTGYVDISAPKVRVASVMKDGRSLPLDKKSLDANTALRDLLKAVTDKAEIIGYDLNARRSNSSLRTTGKRIDSTLYQEQITIPLRSPISIEKPIIGAEKEHPDVKALVNATRIQANNDGVKTILNHARVLEQLVSRDSYNYETDRNSFPGIGRHFLQPVFFKEILNLPNMINSVSSGNRLADIQGAVSTKLNEIVSRVLKQSNYIPVVEQMTGGNVGKVEVIVGTDFRLPQYLNIQGDPRLFGSNISYRIVSTANKHMSNKIYLTLSRVGSEEGPDPFSYGTFVWSPELMVSTTLDREGTKYHVHMVQPRYHHIVNIPILVELDVVGIEEVTGESTVMVVSPVDVEKTTEYGNSVPFKLGTPKVTPEVNAEKPAPKGAGAGAQVKPIVAGKTD